MIKILDPFDFATKSFSRAGINLHSTDLILQNLIDKITNTELREKHLSEHSSAEKCGLMFFYFSKKILNAYRSIMNRLTVKKMISTME